MSINGSIRTQELEPIGGDIGVNDAVGRLSWYDAYEIERLDSKEENPVEDILDQELDISEVLNESQDVSVGLFNRDIDGENYPVAVFNYYHPPSGTQRVQEVRAVPSYGRQSASD